MNVGFLVQLADGGGRNLAVPQRLGDVLHTAHGDACQVHLDEGLLHAALPAAIPFDDGCLEEHALESRHVERDVTGGRGEVVVIMAAAVALTGLAALVAGSLCQGLRFFFQQFVQGFLHAAADQFIDLPLIISSFSCTIFSDIVCCLLSNVCLVTSLYQRLQAMSSFMRFSICATYYTLSYESGRIAWIDGETKLSGKINIQRSCFSSYYYCSSTAQLCGKLHGGFCTYRIFMRNTDK